MILLVDLCYREHSLGFDEFVLPVRRIVEDCGYPCKDVHYRRIREDGPGNFDGIILCGTPLADNRFLADIQDFGWVEGCPSPVLGICAGMEVITLAGGGTLENCQEIGMTNLRTVVHDPILGDRRHGFPAYELHGFGCIVPPGFIVIAETDACVQVVRHPALPQIGVMFHPEVRNEWVLENFLSVYAVKP